MIVTISLLRLNILFIRNLHCGDSKQFKVEEREGKGENELFKSLIQELKDSDTLLPTEVTRPIGSDRL